MIVLAPELERRNTRTRSTTTHRTGPVRPATPAGDLVWPLTLTLFVVCLVMAAACIREAHRWTT